MPTGTEKPVRNQKHSSGRRPLLVPNHVHTTRSRLRLGVRSRPTFGHVLRGPGVHGGQNGVADRKAMAGHRQEDPLRVSVHRRRSPVRSPQRVRPHRRGHDRTPVKTGVSERTSSRRSATGSAQHHGRRAEMVGRGEAEATRLGHGLLGGRNGQESEPSEQGHVTHQLVQGGNQDVRQAVQDHRSRRQRVHFHERY